MNLITLIGLGAATCTTFSFLPQAIKVIKTRETKDLSLGMYLILTLGIALWLIYGLLINDLPIIGANLISLVFSMTILVFKFIYK
ncbi:hypothetical protein CO046_05560 [Candidatus Peregrinibacteria bacterium CG_4_9_14_0_2_um_filter_53_11]|nr:MAG: hypothetical protein CO046_05560 [Candidatus Peregrinibacteria bacterium CG_4_9_14_0_2_um_filter_53_11]